MLKFFVLTFVLLVVSAAPASKTVTSKVKQTASLENELPGQPTELSGTEQDDDDEEEEEEIDVKAILGQFFRKLKKHPEVIQELIEKEEERLMGRVGLEEGGNHHLNSHETSRELPHEYVYQNSKTVVKKDGQAIVSDQQYDPRSAAAPSSTSGSSNHHDNNIPHHDNNKNIQEDREKIEEIKEKFNKANPIINALPLFHRLPNVQQVADVNQKEITDNSAGDNSKSLSDENTETQPDGAADAKSDGDSTLDIKDDTADSVYDIKEIKHVPIEEELASEVPPSELAAKAELREEAHDALQTAAKEALKTKKYQESLQKEAEEKAKQEEEEAKKKQEAEEKSRMDPYKYLYYYYDYDNDASESKDSGLGSSSEQSYPSDSEESESLESSDESTESTDRHSFESDEDNASPEEDEDDEVNDEEESSEEDVSSEENDSQEDDLKQLLGKNKVSNKLQSM